jgi:hypothetical protein
MTIYCFICDEPAVIYTEVKGKTFCNACVNIARIVKIEGVE